MTSFRPAVILFAKTAGSIHRLGAPRSAPPAPSEWPLLSHSPPLAGSFHFPLSLSSFLSFLPLQHVHFISPSLGFLSLFPLAFHTRMLLQISPGFRTVGSSPSFASTSDFCIWSRVGGRICGIEARREEGMGERRNHQAKVR